MLKDKVSGTTRNRHSQRYSKGADTRRQLLQVAIIAFGESGYASVTTRQIADTVGVALPAIQYYFGSKEGLYLACAEEIVGRYKTTTSETAQFAYTLLKRSVTPSEARNLLKRIFSGLTTLLVASENSQLWATFVAREIREPGPAFEILFNNLWKPGTQLVAELVARAKGKQQADEEATIDALLLIAALVPFQTGRPIATRTLKWRQIGDAQREKILAAINRQIDRIAAS